MHRLWRRTVVRCLGGFYERWPFFVCIHDDGVCGGRRSIVRFDWRFVPLTIYRCTIITDLGRAALAQEQKDG